MHKGGKIPSACVPRKFLILQYFSSLIGFLKSYLSLIWSSPYRWYNVIWDSFMWELQKNISNVFLFCHAHCLLLYTHWIPFHLIKLSSHFAGLLFFYIFQLMQFIYDGLKWEMKNSILNNTKDCNIPFCNCFAILLWLHYWE